MSHQNLGRIERGLVPLGEEHHGPLARALGIRPQQLFQDPADASVSAPASRLAGNVATPLGAPVSLADLRAFIAAVQRPAAGAPERSMRGVPVQRRIAVVGEVAAGVWREAVAVQEHELDDYIALDVPGYERADLKAWKVVGPSMNAIYPEGRFVVTAHPAEAGVRIGDHVVVERHQGGLIEVTLKEFTREPNGRIALWPRSNDERFQTPLYLKGPGDEFDQVVIQIVGVVVADYGRRNRPPAVFEP